MVDGVIQIKKMQRIASEQIRLAKESKSYSLDLRYCKLKELPKELIELPWLISMDASSNEISDISVLNELVNLQFLDLDSNQIEDISPLKVLVKLRALSLRRNLIKNLEGLESLVNLTKLNLDHNQIENIEPLLPLFHLNKMQIGYDVDFYFHTGEVSLMENPLIHPPASMIKGGNEVIIKYFEKLKGG